MMLALFLAAYAASACAPVPEPVPLDAACGAVDGDTLRCGDERIRLLGIDSPELPGHCRAGRDCAPGDPVRATRTLGDALGAGRLTIVRVGLDRYGRTLAVVLAGGANLSCAQLAAGSAIYKPRWDNRRLVARACPALAQR